MMSYSVLDILKSQGIVVKQVGEHMYRCNCPFHPDPRPSFTVYTNTDSFYCFACGNSVSGGPVQLLRLFKLPIPKELYVESEDPITNATDDDQVKAFLSGQLDMSGKKTVSIYSKILHIRSLRGRGHNRWLNRIVLALIEGGNVEDIAHSGFSS